MIQPLTVDDADAIASISRAARFDAITGYPDLHTPQEDADFYRSQLQECEGRAFVDDAGAIRGFAVWRDRMIDHLYVEVGHQRSGIGSALLHAALDGIGERPVRLWTFQANPRAVAFYRGHGFVEIERTDGSGNEEGLPDALLELR